MKVISKAKPFRRICKECKCEFEFTKDDIRIDYRDKPLVDCPECGTEIFLPIKL